MSNHLSTTDSFSQHRPHWLAAVLIAVALHLVLIGIAIYWEPTYKPPKTRNKVFVQTVQVSSNRPSAVQQMHGAPPTTPQTAPKPAEIPPIVADAAIAQSFSQARQRTMQLRCSQHDRFEYGRSLRLTATAAGRPTDRIPAAPHAKSIAGSERNGIAEK